MISVKLELTIDKSRRGWSVEERAFREGCPVAVTNSGQSTLASALWHSIRTDYITEVSSVTVKGKPVSSERVYQIIEKDLSGGVLAYALPGYARVLGVAAE